MCEVGGCDYKSKIKGNLRKHKAFVHDIDVVYYLCDVDGCEYKTKTTSNLRQHKTGFHGIV